MGFPAKDADRNVSAEMERIFADVYDVKRLQPGRATQYTDGESSMSHDCSTLGGNSGSPLFDLFTVAAQTVIDSGDPINWAAATAATNAILLQEVVGSDTSLPDQVIPNAVPGFPLSGTEPLIAAMGLAPIIPCS